MNDTIEDLIETYVYAWFDYHHSNTCSSEQYKQQEQHMNASHNALLAAYFSQPLPKQD